MKTLETIILATDLSPAAGIALNTAAEIATTQNATLHVTHTIPLERTPFEPSETNETISNIRAEVESNLRKTITSRIDTATPLDFHVMIGHPLRETYQLVHDIDADLLVMGFHGHSEHRIGTHASKCLRKCPCPVLLTLPESKAEFTRIIAATDFSAASRHAVDFAALLASHSGADLQLAHIYTPALHLGDYSYCEIGSYFDPDTFSNLTKIRKDQLAELAEEIQTEHPHLTITTFLKESHQVAHELCTLASEDPENTLLAIGTRGASPIRSLLLGTTAERILRETPSSLLAVKPADFHYAL